MSRPVRSPVAGGELAGYMIDATFVGRGGMGEVFRATTRASTATLALKVLAPQLADSDRFRELLSARVDARGASSTMPNVIPIFEAGETDGNLFIAMRRAGLAGRQSRAVGTVRPQPIQRDQLQAAQLLAQRVLGDELRDLAERLGVVEPQRCLRCRRDDWHAALCGDHLGRGQSHDS